MHLFTASSYFFVTGVKVKPTREMVGEKPRKRYTIFWSHKSIRFSLSLSKLGGVRVQTGQIDFLFFLHSLTPVLFHAYVHFFFSKWKRKIKSDNYCYSAGKWESKASEKMCSLCGSLLGTHTGIWLPFLTSYTATTTTITIDAILKSERKHKHFSKWLFQKKSHHSTNTMLCCCYFS